MKFDLSPAIIEATRLTRAGRLDEAMALLRGGMPAPAPAPSREPDGAVIELTAEHVTLAPKPRSAPTAVAGAFLDRSFRDAAGTIAGKLYVPHGLAPGAPLVVMLHGCTQSPDDFARGTRMNALADRHGVLVLYPAQASAANAQRCWNWFQPGHQQRDRGEPALIAGFTRAILAEYDVDPARVYVAGLSAGGAAAAVMAEAYPDLYAAVGVHSGLACGAARDLSSALGAMRGGAPAGRRSAPLVPTISFHGDRDTTVNEANARALIARASTGESLTTIAETGRSVGGRGYTRVSSSDGAGRTLIEQWTIHGAGHAWAGGDAAGSYTDPAGPDASGEMLRFFLEHRR